MALPSHPAEIAASGTVTDDRPPIKRMRRIQLWQVADAHGVDYPAGATKDEMITILNAAYARGIDIYNRPKPRPEPAPAPVSEPELDVEPKQEEKPRPAAKAGNGGNGK